MNMKKQTSTEPKLTAHSIDYRELSIDGNWVHLSDNEKSIDVYISNFFWRQAVFINGVKVSQQSGIFSHDFTYERDTYETSFHYTNWREGECRLRKNGELIDSNYFSLYDEHSKNDFKKLVGLHSVFALGVGVLISIAFFGIFRAFL